MNASTAFAPSSSATSLFTPHSPLALNTFTRRRSLAAVARLPQRAVVTAQAGDSSYDGASGGSAYDGASGEAQREKVEYIIRPDGRVEELVTGVRGSDCVKVTQEINAKLGEVLHTEHTDDYFKEKLDNTLTNVNETNEQW